MKNNEDFEALNSSLKHEGESQEIKVYPQRWLILVLLTFYSISSCIQVMEYSVIADVITDYYKVSYEIVDWSALIFAAVFMIFAIPVTYLMDIYGIQKTFFVGVIGSAFGACLKLGSVSPDRFWLALISQAIISLFQIPLSPLIPKVAAVWFGYNQIAIACGLGVVGYQMGIAVSFYIPPAIVFKGKVEEVESRIYILNILYASLAVVIVPLILLFLTDKPPTPPSIAQQQSIRAQLTRPETLWKTIIRLFKMKSYVIFLIIFGVNLGITWPLQILSNQVILYYYPDAAYHVGIIGLLQTIFGIFGSMGISAVLDKFKKIKETCWVVHGVYLIILVIYVAALDQGIACIYITSILIGVSMGSLTLNINVIMEFSYPVPEGIPLTLACCWMQMISLGLTYFCGYLLRTVSAVWANVMLIIFVGVTDLLFFILKFDLKRQAVQELKSDNEGYELNPKKLTIEDC